MPSARFFQRPLFYALLGVALLAALATSFIGLNTSRPAAQAVRTLADTQQNPGTHPLDTLNGIHPFLVFDYHFKNSDQIPQGLDFMFGAQGSSVASLRTSNPNMLLTYYIPFHADYGTFGNNSNIHDFSYWQSVHPDWILYKCDRTTPAYQYGAPNMPLDFTNPAVLNWQMQTYVTPAMRFGYNGLAVDNIDFGNWYQACGSYINGQWVQLFSGQSNDAKWTAGVLSWLTQMRSALNSLPSRMALFPNLAPGYLPLNGSVIQQVVSLSDGILDEGGFTTYSDRYLSTNDYVKRVRFMEYVQDQQKPYYLINSFQSLNRSAMQWSLAAYLMGKKGQAELFTSTYQGYGVMNLFPEYSAAIGSAAKAMYTSQNVYWRDYSNGLVLANPSKTTTYKVTLNAAIHYTDVYGKLVGSKLTLAPFTGLVLLVQTQVHVHSQVH